MAFEVSCCELTEEQQFAAFESATHSITTLKGEDPLDILLELEQLAIEEGFDDIHHFVSHYLGD